MKKQNLLATLFLCAICTTFAIGADLTGSANSTSLTEGTADSDSEKTIVVEKNPTNSSDTSKVEESKQNKDSKKEEEKATGLATLPDGKAYVGVYSYLNLRDGAWGSITGSLYNNEEVTITGREGDWYKVTTSKGDGYVHARYIFDSPDKRYYGDDPSESGSGSGSSGTVSTSDVIMNVPGDSVQAKVVNAAKQVHDKYQGYKAFPYDPLTQGGNLGCAQVATTVLKAAGVLNKTCLNCTGTIDLLKAAGWSSVTWPPYQAGDVVFWETYQPGPSHVGIVMNSGNSAQAMNNSSSKRMPQYSDIESMKICKIMRKL